MRSTYDDRGITFIWGKYLLSHDGRQLKEVHYYYTSWDIRIYHIHVLKVRAPHIHPKQQSAVSICLSPLNSALSTLCLGGNMVASEKMEWTSIVQSLNLTWQAACYLVLMYVRRAIGRAGPFIIYLVFCEWNLRYATDRVRRTNTRPRNTHARKDTTMHEISHTD